MVKTKHLIFIFVPAILVVSLTVFIRVAQYRPLYPKPELSTASGAPATESSFVPTSPDDAILGDKRAGKTIIAFEDLACERCREQIKIYNELIAKYPGRVKVIIKALPVTRFPFSSTLAHTYAYCARAQDAWSAFSEKVIAHEGPLDPTALQTIARAVDLDETRLDNCLESGQPEAYQKKVEELAQTLGITAVPAVFVENQLIPEPTTVAGWGELLGL